MIVRGLNNPTSSRHGGRSDLPDHPEERTVRFPKTTAAAKRLRTRAAIPFLAVLAGAARAEAVTLPPGFQETVVFSGLNQPTAIQFASDGRIFVAEKSGIIKVFDNLADTTPTVFADLRTKVHNYWDRGLLGLALHPSFPAQPWVYVLYTYDAPIGGVAPTWGTAGATTDTCPDPPGGTTDGCVVSGRLSRLQASGNVMTGAEDVLVEGWFQQFPSHSVGTLAFGGDGALYASGGDGASFYFTDYGQKGIPPNPGGDPPVPVGGAQTPPTAEGGALRSQDLRTSGDPVGLNGAILRLDPETGAAMAGNPLSANPDPNARRIIAYGLRNPFRMTVRPGTSEIWIGDVGYHMWEEIDRIASTTDAVVENFGWPCYEGAAKQSAYDAADLDICENLYTTPSAVTPPYFTYAQGQPVVPGEACPTGSSSISAISFYNGSGYPASYAGALFFADYSRQCMWVMPKGANGQPDPGAVSTFGVGVSRPVDLKPGPNGDLFYVDLLGGTIRRIQYTGSNQSPTAVIQALPSSGPLPLQVHFDGTGSSDPNAGDTLTYAWDLDGDGAFDDSTASKPTLAYAVAGPHTVGLRVTDPHSATGTASVVITAGDAPPTATIVSPAPTLTWKVEDTISFSGSATDAKDGPLPASALSWSLLMHHCPSTCHIHPIQDFVGVASGSFPAPDHEYPSHLELKLTATDSSGLTDTKSVLLNPKTVSLGLQSSPPGLQLVLGSGAETAPLSRSVIVGSFNTLSAPFSQTLGPTTYEFGYWSTRQAATHSLIAPEAPETYTATYGEPLSEPWLHQDVGAVPNPGTAVRLGATTAVTGSGSDIFGVTDQFHFAYQPLSGDGVITARVASLQNTNNFAKAGVMIRQSLTPNSPYAMMELLPQGTSGFQWRPTAGATTSAIASAGAAPHWVRLARSGNTLTASRSSDGIDWIVVGSKTVVMPANVYVGLAVTSHNAAATCTAVFDNVTMPDVPPAAAIMSPAGGSVIQNPASVAIDANATDSDGSIAQVEFFDGAALLGTVNAAPFTFNWIAPAPGAHSLTVRATDNEGLSKTSAPINVTINSTPPLPVPWQQQDIGPVAVPGTASFGAGTFTVEGAGTDVWGVADQFHFVYRTLSGDGEIVARVASIENTNNYAKAGVMIRKSLAPASPYAMMEILARESSGFQWRLTPGAATLASGAAGAAPFWVRLARSGDTVTASRSADGFTWTEVGSATVDLGDDAFVGLAVTSHASAQLCTATFDNVSVN